MATAGFGDEREFPCASRSVRNVVGATGSGGCRTATENPGTAVQHQRDIAGTSTSGGDA